MHKHMAVPLPPDHYNFKTMLVKNHLRNDAVINASRHLSFRYGLCPVKHCPGAALLWDTPYFSASGKPKKVVLSRVGSARPPQELMNQVTDLFGQPEFKN